MAFPWTLMLCTIKVVQEWAGLGWAFAAGWVTYLTAFPFVFPNTVRSLVCGSRAGDTQTSESMEQAQ
jgi:hypothetical protein